MNWSWKLVLPLAIATAFVGPAFANEDASHGYVATNAAVGGGDAQSTVLSGESGPTAIGDTSKATYEQLADCRQELRNEQTDQLGSAKSRMMMIENRRRSLGK